MAIVKLSDSKYINLDRMTYTEPARNGDLVVHFDVGGGDVAGPSCCMKLEQSEAAIFRQFLDAQVKRP